jgi:hypothetical protein
MFLLSGVTAEVSVDTPKRAINPYHVHDFTVAADGSFTDMEAYCVPTEIVWHTMEFTLHDF